MVAEKVGSAGLTFFTMTTPTDAQKDDILTYGRQLKSFRCLSKHVQWSCVIQTRKFGDKVNQRASLKFQVYACSWWHAYDQVLVLLVARLQLV